MPESDVLKAFLSGSPPKNVRIVAARGVMPLTPGENLLLVAHLTKDADAEIAGLALRTFQGWAEQELLAQAKSANTDPRVLSQIAESVNSDPLLEAVILNSSTPGQAVATLASRVGEHLLEVILYNQARILDCPEILERVKGNPHITPNIQRLVLEIESEYFESKKSEYIIEEVSAEAEEITEEAFSLLIEEAATEGDLSLEGLPLDPAEREGAILEKLSKMPVPQKIKRAVAGSREERGILIRDSNKQVSRAVLKSPKLTENEIDSFSAMRNVSEDILREIGNHREWTKRYTVALNLVKNPKTPVFVGQRFLTRLLKKDLTLLMRDRSVSEGIRRQAKKTLEKRNPPK